VVMIHRIGFRRGSPLGDERYSASAGTVLLESKVSVA